MNINEAKQEILNTVKAYLLKDDSGEYIIPVEKQRPIYLYGPPGIGKTAVVEQAAAEAGINLVSYTITHHTRQSAIGLPFIKKHDFGGREYEVTEYTMSEILASVYEQIEKSGVKEGILFLDEINCVSETLAPTMLQFLQYKTFGTHRVPDGFVIVTAGNPPQYNRSVRDFDIVTLDRVKKIDIDVDYDAFKEYAMKAGIHGSILGYLNIHKDLFYRIRNDADGRFFVTARGWEDLSKIIIAYEKLGIEADRNLFVQYIQDPEVADDFASYYLLWNRYREVYRIPDILSGQALRGKSAETEESFAKLTQAPFDEKYSVLSLLISELNSEFMTYNDELEIQRGLYNELKNVLNAHGSEPANTENANDIKASHEADSQSDKSVTSVNALLDQNVSSFRQNYEKKLTARILSHEEAHIEKRVITELENLQKDITLQASDLKDDDNVRNLIRSWFNSREAARQAEAAQTNQHLTNAFSFIDEVFQEGQEMVLFLTELSSGFYCLKFINDCGNESYYKYNKLLLLKDRKQELIQEIKGLEL